MKITIKAEGQQPRVMLNRVATHLFQDTSWIMEPALREASHQLQQFHETQGNGRWKRLKRSTLERRKRAGQREGTPIGVQSGRLRAALAYGHPDHRVVKLHDQAWYSYPDVRVTHAGKSAGVAFLFSSTRRLWPPTRGAMTDAVNGVAERVFSARLREVTGGA